MYFDGIFEQLGEEEKPQVGELLGYADQMAYAAGRLMAVIDDMPKDGIDLDQAEELFNEQEALASTVASWGHANDQAGRTPEKESAEPIGSPS